MAGFGQITLRLKEMYQVICKGGDRSVVLCFVSAVSGKPFPSEKVEVCVLYRLGVDGWGWTLLDGRRDSTLKHKRAVCSCFYR